MRAAIIFIALVFSLPNPATAEDTALTKPLAAGEAFIWYLGHSGWAVRTQDHFLIFDYWEAMKTMPPGEKFEKPADASLATGFIVPDEIADQDVIVFVSHAHSDHYDPVILEWRKSISNIHYVFGWDVEDVADVIRIDEPRKSVEIDGVKVFTIFHDFDGIPESAFLVQADGLSIYHSGDHGCGPATRERFIENIDYLAGIDSSIDIAFTVTWGGEDYMIKKFSPKAVFPQHEGGAEYRLRKWADKAVSAGIKAPIYCAEKRGQRFFYSAGAIRPD
jgi:L-ascorbate metabolism protein UlaG (beta-lactamase superfamily)